MAHTKTAKTLNIDEATTFLRTGTRGMESLPGRFFNRMLR
jgi:hypothetical protein